MWFCCSQGRAGNVLLSVTAFAVTPLFTVETILPGFAVPEASTTLLVLPFDGGLNGVGPEEGGVRSQGLKGGTLAEITDINYTK